MIEANIYLSIILFILFSFAFYKCKTSFVNKIILFTALILSLISYFAYYICDHYTADGISQSTGYYMQYHLNDTRQEELVFIGVALFNLTFLILFFIWILFFVKRHTYSFRNIYLLYFAICVSLIYNPAVYDLMHLTLKKSTAPNV